MGLFDGFKYRKAARDLCLTIEQYKEFATYQESDRLTIEEYHRYLKDYAGKKSLRWFIDQVLHAPIEEPKVKVQQKQEVPAYLRKDVSKAEMEPQPKFTIEEGELVELEVPEGCKKVVIPEGVTKIIISLYKEPDRSVDQIETLVLPSTMKKITAYGLSEFSGIKNLILSEGLEVIESNGLILRNIVKNNVKNLVLPSTVRFIGSAVFGDEVDVETVTILSPNAKICCNAMPYFRKVGAQLNIPHQLSYFADYLKDIEVDVIVNYIDVSESDEDACFDEAEFEIADGYELRSAYVPRNCKQLVIPECVEEIAPVAFRGAALEEVVLPRCLRKIGEMAFEKCKKLKTVHLPECIEEIEMAVFEGCTSLISITLPENIKKIGFQAFADCKNLRLVNILCTDAEIGSCIFDGCSDVTITMPFAARKIGEKLCDPERNIRIVYLDAPEEERDIWQPEELDPKFTIENGVLLKIEIPEGCKKVVIPEGVTEMPKVANKEPAAEEFATVKILTAKPAGVLYAVGQEPDNIRVRLDRLFEKLDGAYPDKVISGLAKNHKHWAETVTELYQVLGYQDSWSFLEAYGYSIDKQQGGRPVKDRTAVIDELKRRYPEPVAGSVAFLMEQNPDLAPRIKTLQNSAQSVFGMKLADYLRQEGILAEKKVEPKIEKTVVKQPTPEEKLEQIVAELKRRYPTLKSAPKSLAELKEKNADLQLGTLNMLTQKVVQKTASEYCLALGLICDAEKLKKSALDSAADGRDGWGEQFTRIILDRGVNMFIGDEVKSLEKTANGYAAKVKGTSMYSVNIGILGDEVRSMSCTCPYAADGLNCKHMAAVLFETGAKLYVPKTKKPQPVYARTINVISKSCGNNEILIVSKDKAVLQAAVNSSFIDQARVNIHPCSENPAYYLCEVQIDEREVNLRGLMEMVICPSLNGRGIALGRQVDDEHEVSDIGFYDGECLWAGSEFDLMYPDSDAPDEPEEWAYECNSKKKRTWVQSKKVWKKIWNKIPYYKVSDLIACDEENGKSVPVSAKKSPKISCNTGRCCESGELMVVCNNYEGIESLVYEQEEMEAKEGICQCSKSPGTWYTVFDLNVCEDVEVALDALQDLIGMFEGGVIFVARQKGEAGSDKVWFFDGDALWADMLEEDLTVDNDPAEEMERYRQEVIYGMRDEEQSEMLWRDVRGRLLGMTTEDWAHFIETYCSFEEE